MKNKPTVIIVGLILKNNRFLCIKQDKGEYKDFIWVPAGHLEPNETVGEGVIREVKEETGLDVRVKKLVLKTEDSSFLSYFYLCGIIGGELSTKGEIKEIFWLSFNEILGSKKVFPLLYLVASLSIHKPNFYKGIEKVIK
jgi:8-oxo-dGTP diphosphatase